MPDKQILVDEDKINATHIVINVKTLSILVFFIISSLGTMFGVLNSNISNVQQSVDDLEVIKVQPLDAAYHILDKQVYFLINRTNSRHEDSHIGIAPKPTTPTFP